MTANGWPTDPPGRQFFSKNRAAHPPEVVDPYLNQHIAWAADGTVVRWTRGEWSLSPQRDVRFSVRG